MKVETFHSLKGSKAKMLKHFCASLRPALAELEAEGFLVSWVIDPRLDIARVMRKGRPGDEPQLDWRQ